MQMAKQDLVDETKVVYERKGGEMNKYGWKCLNLSKPRNTISNKIKYINGVSMKKKMSTS